LFVICDFPASQAFLGPACPGWGRRGKERKKKKNLECKKVKKRIRKIDK